MALTDEQLMEIRKREEAATPGPWFIDDGVIKTEAVRDRWYDQPATIAETFHEIADDDFIAHAREDIPKLIAEVIRLRAIAHGLLESYDDSARRVIDEVVGTGRKLTLSYHEFLIKSYQNEINGVDEK